MSSPTPAVPGPPPAPGVPDPISPSREKRSNIRKKTGRPQTQANEAGKPFFTGPGYPVVVDFNLSGGFADGRYYVVTSDAQSEGRQERKRVPEPRNPRGRPGFTPRDNAAYLRRRIDIDDPAVNAALDSRILRADTTAPTPGKRKRVHSDSVSGSDSLPAVPSPTPFQARTDLTNSGRPGSGFIAMNISATPDPLTSAPHRDPVPTPVTSSSLAVPDEACSEYVPSSHVHDEDVLDSPISEYSFTLEELLAPPSGINPDEVPLPSTPIFKTKQKRSDVADEEASSESKDIKQETSSNLPSLAGEAGSETRESKRELCYSFPPSSPPVLGEANSETGEVKRETSSSPIFILGEASSEGREISPIFVIGEASSETSESKRETSSSLSSFAEKALGIKGSVGTMTATGEADSESKENEFETMSNPPANSRISASHHSQSRRGAISFPSGIPASSIPASSTRKSKRLSQKSSEQEAALLESSIPAVEPAQSRGSKRKSPTQ